jgi:purine-nucleoside phosphorylase
MSEESEAARAAIQAHGVTGPIDVAFVLGTGLGNIVDAMESPIVIPYAELPGFPRPNVSGHEGRLVIGRQEGAYVAYLQGRAHYYEQGDSRAMSVPIETLATFGTQALVLTAAVGSLNATILPGTLMIVTDHINFGGPNPLIGTTGGDRFVSMTQAYDTRLSTRLKKAAASAGIAVHEGVYMWFSGPSFETPAEIKIARLLGADVVGMSVVPEVILARRIGLRVAAVTMVSNFATGFHGGNPTHAETQEYAGRGAVVLKRLVRAFLRGRETT